MTSFCIKTMERLCDLEIRKNLILHPSQHAYLPGRSTETALHQAVSRIEGAMVKGESALGAFLDIEGAFDKVSLDSITSSLSSRCVQPSIVRWITAMLSNREVRLEINGCVVQGSVVRGCPQGGVLSPILWNLVMDSLLVRLNDSGLYSLGYADDLLILLVGKFESSLCELMNTALAIVAEWCRESELSVNAEKTVLVMFNRRRTTNMPCTPVLNGTSLDFSDEVRYLGVYLDRKLSWKRHIEEKTNKAKISLWQCRRVVGRTWGFSPRIMRWIFTAVVRPMLTYAACVWWHKASGTLPKKLLVGVQRTACLAITGAMKTAPTSALEVLSGLTPIDIFIEQVAGWTATRLRRTKQWESSRGQTGHVEIVDKTIRQTPELDMPSDYMPKKQVFHRPYKITIEMPSGSTPGDSTEFLDVYTDGSNDGYLTGAGIFFESFSLDLQLPMGIYATVFQAEAYAVLVAANTLIEMSINAKRIRIFSDSQSTLRALASNSISSRLIHECFLSLTELSRENSVQLFWVRGHSGLPGNEKADALAKAGTRLGLTTPEPFLGLSICVCKSLHGRAARSRHLARWTNLQDCRHARNLITNSFDSISKNILSLPRSKVAKITEFLTGHGKFRKHLNRMGLATSSNCRWCNDSEETAEHVICTCPALSMKRWGKLGAPDLDINTVGRLPTKSILGFIDLLDWQ